MSHDLTNDQHHFSFLADHSTIMTISDESEQLLSGNMLKRQYLNLQVNHCLPSDEVECASEAEIDEFFKANVF